MMSSYLLSWLTFALSGYHATQSGEEEDGTTMATSISGMVKHFLHAAVGLAKRAMGLKAREHRMF